MLGFPLTDDWRSRLWAGSPVCGNVAFTNHLTRRRNRRIVQLQIHEDRGTSAARAGRLSAGDRACGRTCLSQQRRTKDRGNRDCVRRDSSCCRPALTAAAACREVEADLGDGDGLWPRRPAISPLLLVLIRDIEPPEIDREGGRELRSGIS